MDVFALWATITGPEFVLRTVAVLLLGKVALASLAAARRREFDWRSLPAYLHDDILPYGGGLMVLWVLALIDPMMQAVFTASAATVSAMLLRQVWDHARALFGVTAPDKQEG